MNTGKEIVVRIDSILAQKKENREGLIKRCDVSASTISTWKTRGSMPAADTAIKIAEYLGVSVEWLITGNDPENLTIEDRQLVGQFHTLDETDRNAVKNLIATLLTRYPHP